MQEYLTEKEIHCVYTYNFDCVLSQSIQYLHCGDIYDNDVTIFKEYFQYNLQ